MSTAPETARDRTAEASRFAELGEDELAAGILPRLRSVVQARPDAVAVSDDAVELTYTQLASQAARILAAVRRSLSGLGPQLPAVPDGQREPVGMLFGHECAAVSALVAVKASGHPVLVLDPRSPAPRLRQLVERAGVRLVVCDEPNEQLAQQVAQDVTVPLRDAPEASVEELWRDIPDPNSPAALAFTSGSTGVPKPVANDHVLFMRDAWNSSIATGAYDSHGVIAHTLPIAFHAGLTTTVHGLVVGAPMRLYDARSRGIARLPAFIAEHGCTIMIASPAILRGFCASEPDPELLQSLTSVTIAGETAYGRDVEAVRLLVPPTCVLRNRYGSSETGLIAEFTVSHDASPQRGQLPVGIGVGRTRLGLVGVVGDGDVEPGQTGRMTVTAPQVALGYWGMPAETEAAFTDNADGTRTYLTSDIGRLLPDGSMQLVGRADHSVKIRGYLVDPGEVDAALFALPSVKEAVVTGVPRPTGGTRLVAYVAASDDRLDADAVRAGLRATLPAHMVPEAVVFVPALPRSERGKIDRSALPEPPAVARVEEDGTMSHWEQLVAMVWARVLDLDHVGRTDDFFALGGDSLATEELMSRLRDELGLPAEQVHTSLLAQAPVLHEFARRLKLASASTTTGALVPLQTCGTKPPLFVMTGAGGLGIAFIAMARLLGPDQPSFALQSPVIEARGLPERSVPAMARRHLKLIRTVQPHGPYHLAGHSFGGIIAFEMAQQLKAQGEEVALLAILDSFPPHPDLHLPPPRLSPLTRLKREIGLHYTTLRRTPGGNGFGRLFEQSKGIAHRYRGKPWDGRTVVFVADSPEKHMRSRWDTFLTGSWRQVEVSGDHYTMIRSPWVKEVADALSTELG